MEDLANISDLPQEIRDYVAKAAAGEVVEAATLDAVLPGTEWMSVRKDLQEGRVAQYRDRQGDSRYLVADLDENGRVMAIAAAIPRNPGKSSQFLAQIEDFKELATGTKHSRKEFLALAHRVYRAQGEINNGLNKLAALVGTSGSFKVRGAKGQRGKGGDKRAVELQAALNWWKDNVNARGEEHAITGDRGIRSFVRRGARLSFIEGDHFARHVWRSKKVQVPNVGPLSMPMNLQTFSAQHIEVMEGFEGTDYEAFYWVPPKKFVQTLKNPKDPNARKILDKMLDPKIKNALIKTGKWLLDPALLIHIKHRGTGTEPYGESKIEPTLSAVRYLRALDALEVTTITNLINRLVVVKVGSDNPASVYHRQEVSSARLSLLQRLMQNVGPSAMVLWAGPDIQIEQIGAHDQVLDLTDRYRVGERRLLMALGIPAVLMLGEGTDGKAAGFAAALGVVAELQEIQDQYEQALVALAERIAAENGYEQVDVVWEWHDNLLENHEAAAELIIKLFTLGLVSTETALDKLDIDYGSEEIRQQNDVKKGYKDDAFGAPKGAVRGGFGANPSGLGGEDGGRPTKEERPERDPREGKETVSPVENK
jgi:hypothetical protein